MLTTTLSRPRRAVDIALGSLLLVFAVGRPVFFRQDRVGEGGQPFRLTKLRTMTAADRAPSVTAADDVRITRLGRFLRRSSIDELPQLWHVVRGQMTLVGPRPESVGLAARYPQSCRFILHARPGLTGPAQLAYRERSAVPPAGVDVEEWYLEVLVPLRVAADRAVLDDAGLGACLAWLGRTALFVLGLADYQRAVVAGVTSSDSANDTARGSHRALRHSPVVRSNSKL